MPKRTFKFLIEYPPILPLTLTHNTRINRAYLIAIKLEIFTPINLQTKTQDVSLFKPNHQQTNKRTHIHKVKHFWVTMRASQF